MLKKKIYDIIQISDKSNIPSRLFDILIVITIVLNITVLFMDTFDNLSAYHSLFKCVEWITTAVFCVEYILRIWTADLLYSNMGPFRARMRFLRSFEGVIDILTIIPAFFLTGFIAFRMLRVVRIFHLFRINVQYDSFNVIASVILEKKNQLASSVFIIIVLLFSSSLCLYSVEHTAQPDVFENGFSGVWWAMSTLLTVGYGDIYPVTSIGRCMTIVIALLGVGVVAIPTGIISAGFVEKYDKLKNSEKKLIDIKEIGEILVDDDIAGQNLDQFANNYNVSVLLLIRNDLKIIPHPGVVFEKGDIILCQSAQIEKNM